MEAENENRMKEETAAVSEQEAERETLGSLRESVESAAADDLLAAQPLSVRAWYFKKLGLPGLLYAAVYTACMFQNSSSIMMPVWIAASIGYAGTVMKNMNAAPEEWGIFKPGEKLKAGSGFYIVIMMLLGTASYFTDNCYIIFLNYCGFFMVLTAFLLHNFYDNSRWGFAQNLIEAAAAVIGAAGCIFTPFTDFYAFYEERRGRKSKKMRAVSAGLAFAVPGLLVLGACLMSADAVFRAMILSPFTEIRFSMKWFRFDLMLIFGFFSSYCGMRYLLLHSRKPEQPKQAEHDPLTAMIFNGLILVMYLVFCVIQIIYLFAGEMQLPAGVTYAEYAHSGFFQLLFVCCVNFGIVLLVKKYFARHKVLDGMMLGVCGCTFIMGASSAYRMLLYIQVYQLTFLRVSVLAALLVLGVLTAGAAAMVLKPDFPLFRYCAAAVSVSYLIFAFSHVDYWIASYNLSHAQESPEHMDWQYLAQLSLDAAPAAAAYYAGAPEELQDRLKRCAERAEMMADSGPQQNPAPADSAEYLEQEKELQEDVQWFTSYMYRAYETEKTMNIRNFNLSRHFAVKALSLNFNR